jgi:peptidoglycan/LPS O-acetylase OafA/YrhL
MKFSSVYPFKYGEWILRMKSDVMLKAEKVVGQKNTIAVLDGVRAVACLLVIVYHIYYLLSLDYPLNNIAGPPLTAVLLSGWSGVTLFFVLSGFLLFLPYAQAIIWQEKWPSARQFYLRRMLRILPGYYFALLLLILLLHPEYLQPENLKNFAIFLALLMDAPATHLKINGPFWTLAVEWQYYLILPWVALGTGWIAGRGKTPEQRLLYVICCLAVFMLWGIGTRYIGRYYFTFHPNDTFLVERPVMDKFLLFTYGTTGKYYEDFSVGMLLSTLYIYTRNAAPDHALSRWFYRYRVWLLSAGLLWLLFLSVRRIFPALSFLGGAFGQFNWLCEVSYAVGFGLCITALLYGPSLSRTALELMPMRWLGAISYSLYIWHIPFFNFLREKILPSFAQNFYLDALLYWLMALLVIIPFCYLVYRLIEQPWMRVGRKQEKKVQPA